MTWYGNANDAWTGTRSASAWAANPSYLGTHWFVNENRYEGFVDEGKFVNFQTLLDWVNGHQKENDKNHVIFGVEPTGPYWLNLAYFLTAKGYDFVLVNPMNVVERLIYCRTTGGFRHLFCQIMYKERADSFFDYGTKNANACISVYLNERPAVTLKKMQPDIGDVLYYNIEGEHAVFNLVTKKCFYHKPTRVDFNRTILNLKTAMERYESKKLAIQLIGVGLGKLSWNESSKCIQKVFSDMDIEILVCIETEIICHC
jgi:hypothetical protein